MVRRFDEALTVWEELLADPETSAAQLDASGVLVDYLNVAIRVRTDPARAKDTLKQFSARKDLPVYLTRRVGTWRSALETLDADSFSPSKTASVEFGAKLAQEGGRLAQGPYGRDGLVQDLAAASQLVRFLEADRVAMHRETRNRTASERASAARAYAQLEETQVLGFGGASGAELPADIWTNLKELRELMGIE